MVERGETPLYGPKNKVGEGAGHKVKRSKSGGGYARSSHHEGLAGPRDGRVGGSGDIAHHGYHTTNETKPHGSSHKLPMEKGVPFRKGLVGGDHFESEIKEHFPTKKGVAGINKTAMPHTNSPTPNESVSEHHGKASGKAEHHPSMDTAKHSPMYKHAVLDHGQGVLAHGFGHTGDQRRGVFRLSGHKQAHQIGARSKTGPSSR